MLAALAMSVTDEKSHYSAGLAHNGRHAGHSALTDHQFSQTCALESENWSTQIGVTMRSLTGD